MREQSTTNNIFQPKHVRGGETKVMKAMKKSILTFLAFALVFTMAMPAFAANVATGAAYSDIQDGKVADAVKVLSSLDVLKGYPDGTFKPDNTITRAEFAAVAVRLLGYEKAAQASQGKTAFKDEVLPWASGYVNVASQQKILTGYPDGTFRANQPVTQAEALTILVRALGYEPVVDKAGWPYNYLVIADQVGLTKDLSVVANESATRGFVAQITSTSVAKPKLVQTGFGDMKQYVVSGTNGTDEKTILSDNLGYKKQTNVVTEIPRVNSKLDDNEIKLVDKDGKDLIVNVPEGFDFEAALGTKLTYYVDKDDNVIYAKAGEVKYDAIKVTKDELEIKLIDADKKYDVDKDVVVYLNGSKAKFSELNDKTFDYAKVALNDKDDVRFIEAYTFGTFVVNKVDDNVLVGYGEELNIKDYAFVKEGKTIKASDLAKGDLLFFNTAAKFGEVYNNTVSGKIDKVYTTLIRVNDKDYKFNDGVTTNYVKNDKITKFDDEVAEQMQAEGDVTLFLNRAGDLIFVAGELGEVKTSSFLGFVTEAVMVDKDLRDNYSLDFQVVTQAEEVKPYIVEAADVTIDLVVNDFKVNRSNYDDVNNEKDTDGNYVKKEFKDLSSKEKTAATKVFFTGKAESELAGVSSVIKITVDDKGNVTKLGLDLASANNTAAIDVTADKYVTLKDTAKQKVSNSAYVFLTSKYATSQKARDVQVVKWDEIKDFEMIPTGATVFYADGYVTSVVTASATLGDSVFKTAIVTDLSKLRGTDEYRVTAYVDGEKVTLYSNESAYDGLTAVIDDIKDKGYVALELELAKKNNEVKGATSADVTGEMVVTEVLVGDREINETYTVVDNATVLDLTKAPTVKEIGLRDIVKGDKVILVKEEAGTDFISHVIKTVASTGEAPKTAKVAAEYTTTAATITVTVDNVTDAHAVRVFDAVTGKDLSGFAVLTSGTTKTATITDITTNPVYVNVKVYDNQLKLLVDQNVTLTTK